ncbi:MAG: hypothetical protein Q9173_003711, partial [Seirophora scorigena]
LRHFRSSQSSHRVIFTVKYLPYQLYPEASKEGEDKYEWYKNTKYDGSDGKMQQYTKLMSTYGKQVGIDFDFHGTVANTFNAHRLIQHYQEIGPEVADTIVNSLYAQYFTRRAHPSAPETLLEAAKAAGIDRSAAEAFVNGEYEGLQETKMLLREQASNGVDSLSSIFAFLLAIEFFFFAAEASVLDQTNNRLPRPRPASAELTEIRELPADLEVLSSRALRNINALGPGWTGHIIYTNAVYPYSIGAQILGGFYQNIMKSASGIWTALPQVNSYMVSIGTIRLLLWCNDHNVNITWAFVHDFAARMLTATQLGFVGLFDASFVHIVSGMMVHAQLIIRGKSPPS